MSFSPNYRGNQSKASSRQTTSGYQNGTLSTILQASPVSINTSGHMIPTDVSDEDSVKRIIGLTNQNTPTAAYGSVTDAGRLEGLSTPFSIGDFLFISTSGTLTNIKPDIGSNGFVAGDFVVFVGVIVQNQFNMTLQDIKLLITVIGQL